MRRWSDSQGFTLVEIMVAAVLIGVLMVIAGRFFRQADEGLVVSKARQESQKVNNELQSLIERDLRFRLTDTSFIVSSDQKVLTVTRRQALDISNLATSDQSYDVRFETVCRPVPPELTSYPDLSAQLNGARFQNTVQCLHLVKCGTGQLPRVEITIPSGGRIPPYPNKSFPSLQNISKSVRSFPIATAACFVQGTDQVRVTVDTVYTVSKTQYAPLSQDKSISIRSADYQLLPQEYH